MSKKNIIITIIQIALVALGAYLCEKWFDMDYIKVIAIYFIFAFDNNLNYAKD